MGLYVGKRFSYLDKHATLFDIWNWKLVSRWSPETVEMRCPNIIIIVSLKIIITVIVVVIVVTVTVIFTVVDVAVDFAL